MGTHTLYRKPARAAALVILAFDDFRVRRDLRGARIGLGRATDVEDPQPHSVVRPTAQCSCSPDGYSGLPDGVERPEALKALGAFRKTGNNAVDVPVGYHAAILPSAQRATVVGARFGHQPF